MSSAHYFLATSLPPLGDLGTAPPLSLSDLWSAVAGSSAAPLVHAILLADDLRQWQAVDAGELTDAAPAVLEPGQILGQVPLPSFLGAPERTEPSRVSGYLLWEAYWHHAATVARQPGSAFLRAWIGLEVALGNALAAARARSFAHPAGAHVVAPELGQDEPAIELGVAAWAGAPDPLTALRSLLRTRWDWVTQHEPSFSFSDDELAAYAVKLTLLRDWRRTMGVAA